MGFCGSSPKSQLFLFQVSFEENKTFVVLGEPCLIQAEVHLQEGVML